MSVSESFEEFKERVSKMNYSELLGETIRLPPQKDSSEERQKKLALRANPKCRAKYWPGLEYDEVGK